MFVIISVQNNFGSEYLIFMVAFKETKY